MQYEYITIPQTDYPPGIWKEYIIKYIKYNPYYFANIPIEFQNNKNFILEIIKCDALSILNVNKLFCNDYDIMLESVKQNGKTIKNASDELKNNKLIVLEAINNKYKAISYVPEEMKHNIDIVLFYIIKYKIIYPNPYINLCKSIYDIINNLNINWDDIYNIEYDINIYFTYFLKYILNNHKNYVINNMDKIFINYIYNDEIYLEIFKEFNILIFNIEEITPYVDEKINTKIYVNNEFLELKKKYMEIYPNYTIIFYTNY